MPTVTNKNPQAFSQLEARLKELGKFEVKAGWFSSSVYGNGTPIAYVAAIQEYGYAAGGIPPRPFMRPTIARERNNWIALMRSGAKAILAGNETVASVLDKIGGKAAGDVAKTIASITSPALKTATIAARARKRADRTVTASLSKPLVDSGIMVDSLTHVVEKA
jgi:hypothetical protein